MRVAIAAAGTGGHVYPALAVAEELHSRGIPKEHIVFIGGDRMEATVIPARGYPFVAVDIHGIRRSISMDNVSLPAKVLAARSTIVEEIEERGLEAMVVFGGYVAGPAALAASKASIPLIVHEANAVPGLANRMIARRADTIYVAFAPSLAKLPTAEVIGSPLRGEFSAFDRDAIRLRARARYGLPDEGPVLAVVGGSQGAAFLNDVAAELGAMADRPFSILHVTGPNHHDAIAEFASSHPGWVTVPFEESMIDVYAACDVILCRGGAMTVSEVEATNTPAIIVPLPAGKGYQGRNASDLVASGGGVVVDQTDVASVAQAAFDLITDQDRTERMRSAPRTVDHGRAASVMADRIMGVAHA